MRGAWASWMRGWRGHGLALSLLALLVQALVPAGYMVADGPQDGGPQGEGVVICTGHGPLTARPDLGHPGKAPSSRPDAPCAFAGHGATPTPPLAAALPTAGWFAYAPAVQPWADRPAPGRGLAAPPPPSHAPPLRSI